MEAFTIRIAELAASVQCEFASTPAYFRNYLTEAAPEIPLEIRAEDRRFEQLMLDEEADREGMRRRVFTEPFLERAAIQRKMARALLSRDVLLLHGSTVAVDGTAYLFTAASGVGKSTHTRLWMQVFGSRACIVNDDRAFLRLTPAGVTVYGSPWSGKHGLDANVSMPLGGICILERGTENRIVPLSLRQAYPILLNQAFLAQPEQWPEELTARLAASVPLWRMACNKNAEAAQVAYEAMAGRK